MKLEKRSEKFLEDTPCFFIVNKAVKNDKGVFTKFALEVSDHDKYAPRNTGVYNLIAKPLLASDVKQQWSYNVKEQAIYSNYYPGKILSEGANTFLFMYKNKNIKN